MSLTRAWAAAALASALLAGCNDDDGDNPPDPPILHPPAAGTLHIIANGGSGTGGPEGHGGGGGSLVAICRGNIITGLNPASQAPPLPATPVFGVPVNSWADTQVITSGTALVNDDITATTSGTTATLTVAKGDLVINGSLTSLAESSLVINVPAGTLFLHGSIKTGRTDGVDNGEKGGNVFVFALRIVFTGTVDTRGEDHPAGRGGFGGSVNFCTDGDRTAVGTGQTSQIYVGGSFEMAGGNGSGPAALGGSGGNFQTSRNLFDEFGGHFSGAADGTVYFSGTKFNLDGGSAAGSGVVRGGSSGFIYWMGDSGLFFNGEVSGLGGNATSSDGEAHGGSGTGIFVNEFTIGDSGPINLFGSLNLSGGSAVSGPTSKAVGGHSGFLYLINGTDMNFGVGSMTMRGGDSNARGGEGGEISMTIPPGVVGDIHLETAIDVSSGNGSKVQTVGIAGAVNLNAEAGNIFIAGSMTLNGGTGSGATPASGPSQGGLVLARSGSGNGSITFRGSIVANGGSAANDADDTNGAPGGRVDFHCDNPVGSITLDAGSSIQLDGGNAGGPTNDPKGGAGGFVLLRTTGGTAALSAGGGHIHLRGEIAARGGLGGGMGGIVNALSDSDLDGRGGDITLYEGATLDLSGGEGFVGGEGLNDGFPGATFPIAVLFDADGANSNNPMENGVVRNLGLIVSHGAPSNGDGGDVRFDGLDDGLNIGPAPGSLDLQAAGSGQNGGFRGE
jgi:hypothetical protein